MPVERILFASGESVDCRGTINWDAPNSGYRLMPIRRILFEVGPKNWTTG